MITDEDLGKLEKLAAQAGRHWRVCDDVLECGTAGAFHLIVEHADGTSRTAAVSMDVLDEDRALLVYLAAAANLAPLVAAELRAARAR
ncbi:MAG: hypothetical protein ACRDIE_00685 [Chloroflexota bacterium]